MWEEKTVRKLLNKGKLSPNLCGKDERESGKERDCPICLLHYDEINMLKCCNATICTECYLQVQDPIYQLTPCPFCKHERMIVAPARSLNLSEAVKREKDEQKVIEAKIQARKNSESITIQLPQDQTVDTPSDRSQHCPNGTNLSYSIINDGIDTPRTYDFSHLLENHYQSYPRFEFHELYNRNINDANLNLDQHGTVQNVEGLSEESQLALAIHMSLTDL